MILCENDMQGFVCFRAFTGRLSPYSPVINLPLVPEESLDLILAKIVHKRDIAIEVGVVPEADCAKEGVLQTTTVPKVQMCIAKRIHGPEL